MYGYIYETTNLVNNKKYIGQHRSKKFDKSYLGSGVVLLKAIEKYGKENFSCKILKECVSEEDLNLSEKQFILEFSASNSDDYYNIASGGLGHTCEPWNKGKHIEISDKAREALERGRHLPSSEKQKAVLASMRKGIDVSEETRKKLSEAQKGKVCVNNGVVNKYVKLSDSYEMISCGWSRGRLSKNKLKGSTTNR